MASKPPGAWWSEHDQEWVRGERDAAGRLQGVVRYWNAAGELISDIEHVDGRPHGRARRFYPAGSVAHEASYNAGVLDGIRRHHDNRGLLRRESRFEGGTELERTWHRTVEESDGNGVTRSGPVDGDAEIGTWHVRDAGGEIVDTIDLGSRRSARCRTPCSQTRSARSTSTGAGSATRSAA